MSNWYDQVGIAHARNVGVGDIVMVVKGFGDETVGAANEADAGIHAGSAIYGVVEDTSFDFDNGRVDVDIGEVYFVAIAGDYGEVEKEQEEQ